MIIVFNNVQIIMFICALQNYMLFYVIGIMLTHGATTSVSDLNLLH